MRWKICIGLLPIVVALALVACSDSKKETVRPRETDPALQPALDELTRLSSYTETGLSYSEYSDRLLTTRANIDVALQRATDRPAKEQIERAIRYYVEARTAWKMKIDYELYSGPTAQSL